MAHDHQAPIQKILVIKLCCLGDLLQMTPALRALAGHFSEARIDFLCSSWVKDLAVRLPGVDRVEIWDEPYLNRSILVKVWSALMLVLRLRRERYDMAVIAHRFFGFSFLVWLMAIARRIGFDTGKNYWLTDLAAYDANVPERQLYLRLAKAAGAESLGEELEVMSQETDQEKLRRLLDERHISWTSSVIAIVPGGGQNPGMSMRIKRWPVNYYAQLIQKLSKATDSDFVLIGSEDDREVSSEIMRLLSSHERIWDLCGQISWPALMALFSRTALVVGGDTGPLYLAAACQSATVMLYGPTSPKFLAPQGEKNRALHQDVQCSPCCTPDTILQKNRFQGREFVCWTTTHACMNELSVERVFQDSLSVFSEKIFGA